MNIIAIDGPSGSGKSSVAKKVAEKLGILYVTSGIFYRAITYLIVKDDESKVDDFTFISAVLLKNKLEYNSNKIFINYIDCTSEVTKEIYTKYLPTVSTNLCVRDYVNKILRKIAKTNIIVMDGRDIGTAVFPNANLKIYLDASVEVRAKRRYEEVKNKGHKYDDILSRLKNRDKIDSTRKIAPLKVADDAIMIDSTNMTINEVVEKICKIYKEVIE
ncbi:MAG: (d)CMP kinase [Bacilli bacterium]